MPKSMLINVIMEEESRVAIVDGGVLDFFEIETLRKENLKGNIYKAVVENVNSSLEAAFVNCGWERPGFLPLDEVNFRVLPSIKGRKGSSRIQEHVAPGMEILVQVIRDKFNSKPPSLTTYYSIPGRYLVLTPFADGSGISRRIEDEERRAHLRKLVEDLRPPEKFGVIVRTAGLDKDRKELVRDMGYLLRLWETIERAAEVAPVPSLIYRERGLALRTIRDHLTDDVEEVLIDDPKVYESALRFVRAVAPHQERLIRLYTGEKPLFSRFNLEDQIETIYKRRVPLKSGGEIVIEETEAMTAIDVNSSRSREANVEEMALRTNLEAAAEVARQIRLRDIGGLIVIDFIDMESVKHTRAVEKELFEAMRRDKAKYDATKISKLGILEISRQRLKPAKASATYITCTACDGAGTVRSTEAAALAALRKIQTRIVRGDASTLTVMLPTDVALYLLNQQKDELLALEKRFEASIALMPRPDFSKERCDIETTPRDRPASLVSREGVRSPRAARDAGDVDAVSRASAIGIEPEVEPEEKPAELIASRVEPVTGDAATSPEINGLGTAIDEGVESEPEVIVGPESTPASKPVERLPAEARALEMDLAPDRQADGREPSLELIVPSTEGGTMPESPPALAEVAVKKRRRKRGGRGRTRKQDSSGVTVSAEDEGTATEEPMARGDAEPITSTIGFVSAVPEDDSEGSSSVVESVPIGAPRRSGEAVQDPAHAKKRRRRRGGRGRKRATHTEGALSEGTDAPGGAASAPAGIEPSLGAVEAPVEAATSDKVEVVPSTGGSTRTEGDRPKKKRRSRHRPPKRPPETRMGASLVETSVTLAPATPAESVSATSPEGTVPARRTDSTPGQQDGLRQEQDEEDVPGGWWSRLRGSRKREHED